MAWQTPVGVSVGDFSWPYPERIAYGPLMNFGYHDEVLLPLKIWVPEDFPEPVLVIQGVGRVLVCADICIPEQVTVDLTLPVGRGGIDADSVDLFTKARGLIPAVADLAAELVTKGKTLVLNLRLPITSADRIQRIEYFPFAMDLIENPAEQAYELSETGLRLHLQKGFAFDETENPDLSGVMVVQELSGQETIISSFTVMAAASGQSEENLTEMSVVLAILFAFLGGLILNLMPCVFPVLSIKILSLVDSVHGSGHSLRLHGWIYAAGVVASFVGIALILMLLRLGGEAIGWGFQLQSPLVLALLAYLFFLIALNLLGIFEIGTSVMSLGGLGPSSGYLASFATGVLATVVAAPCTVPFMGAAVGFALTQSTMISLVIFGTLGTGMAVPYLLLCYSPGVQARLPAPGRWMQVLKEVMAFPMFASAIWLIWVLGLQTSPTGMMQVLAGVLLLGLAVWVFNNSRNAGMGRFIAALLIVGAVYPVIRLEVPEPDEMTISDSAVVSHQAQEFERYERQALTDAVQRGPVFVNFTAAWCITCKVNEVTVLSTVSVRQAMAANGVTYFRADWTSEDPVITAALAEYGRGGVPLYLLYRQGTERAEVLPQLLTKGIIIDALNRL